MRKTHLRKDSIASKLLQNLVEDLDLFFTVGYRPVAVLKYGYGGYKKIEDAQERSRLCREMKRLEERKILNIQKQSDEFRAQLTTLGAQEYLRLKLQQADLLPKGYLCIVVFDIPETQRKLRHALRQLLKGVGFMQTQRSVWISPFDAGEMLSQLFNSKSDKTWVKCYTAKSHNIST